MESISKAKILLNARELFATKQFGDALLHKKASVASPLPVIDPGGGLHSWWVPLTADDKLAAFFQFLQDGTFMRFSAFQRQENSFEGCPDASDWLEAEVIQKAALAKIRKGEKLQEPYLTYDNVPVRIVWAVPVLGSKGKKRIIYVAGSYAYENAI